MTQLRYTTPHGIEVTRTGSRVPFSRGLDNVLKRLDTQRGAYLSSGYEYPGRYSRWDVAGLCPPLEIVGRGREVTFRALNERGGVLLQLIAPLLLGHPHVDGVRDEKWSLTLALKPLDNKFPEEDRSKQPSPFSFLRALVSEFGNPEDSRLGLIGAFGYDLLLQFDPIDQRLPRDDAKTLHLLFCDDIYFMDRKKEVIERFQYDFAGNGMATDEMPRRGEKLAPAKAQASRAIVSDHQPEEYMRKVEAVREGMRQGNYYEVVLRQTFGAPFTGSASELFRRIQKTSPSPYEFLLQMGDEQLVGASPEMFVRVEADRVETCPIAGTARRSGDPLRDAESIRELLNSVKEESELTMCSDVDRNDKSRVCTPGSVRVVGRRLIESYAGLFHTVDHVQGKLADHFDSLDAFLTHMWAVTVIGAPKKAAAQAVEDLEKDARGWYGGAVGMLSLNGDINTGITIRTVHLKNGEARYAAGATLLYDSDPKAEDEECRLKATNFFRALNPAGTAAASEERKARSVGDRIHLLLVDNEDCFIHTLANYARQTGARVSTYRSSVALDAIRELQPDMVLISPGPARPSDFGVPGLVQELATLAIPTFGVCLGLQGIVEAFGGDLDVLDYPMHGKGSAITHNGGGVFRDLPTSFRVGRYHSLFARRSSFPDCLEITAESEDGIIMGIRHRTLPIEAVQFHPESILSLEGDCGLRLMENMIESYARATVAGDGR